VIGELGVAAPPGPDGAPRMLPLSQLATLEVVEGPAQINRERISRLRVDANVRGRDLASFVEEAARSTRCRSKSMVRSKRTSLPVSASRSLWERRR
jgi:Cu/Ag efflux pump CusA